MQHFKLEISDNEEVSASLDGNLLELVPSLVEAAKNSEEIKGLLTVAYVKLYEETEHDVENMRARAKKWNALKSEVDKFYIDKDGEYSEDNPESQGDLCDIGYVAAVHTGWMS